MEWCAPQPYRKSVAHRHPQPSRDAGLGAGHRPGRTRTSNCPRASSTHDDLDRYRRVLARLAVPYKVTGRTRTERTELPAIGINATDGLVTTVRDLARFDAALDADRRARCCCRKRWPRPGRRPPAATACRRRWGSAGSCSPIAASASCGTSATSPTPIPSLILKLPAQEHDVHPARQQRRPERPVPAAGRRRHQVALRHALPQADDLAALRATLRVRCGLLPVPAAAPPRRWPRSGTSRRSSA